MADISGGFKISLSMSTASAQPKIANCTIIFSDLLASFREANFVARSSSTSGRSAAAPGTALLTSVCQNSKKAHYIWIYLERAILFMLLFSNTFKINSDSAYYFCLLWFVRFLDIIIN